VNPPGGGADDRPSSESGRSKRDGVDFLDLANCP